MGVLDESDSRKGLSVGRTTPYQVLFHYQLVMLHKYAELFHKIKFCHTSKIVEHEQDSIRMPYLTVTPVIYILFFFQAKALMTSQVNT